MTKVLYYKSKQRYYQSITKVNKDVMTKVLYYKSKRSIVLQK